MEDTLQKLKKISFITTSLAVAIAAFTLSSLYYNNGFRIESISYQTMVYFLLGFFHAYNVWTLDNVINEQNKNVFVLFCYSLVYTAWYNVVLLPESGLGLIEWIVVFIVLTSNLITELTTKKINNPFMGKRPTVLIFFGVILFIIKVIIFSVVTGNNIYDSFVSGNETVRFLSVLPIIAFLIFGLISLVSQIYKHITNNFEIKADSPFSFIEKIIKSLLTLSVIVWLPIIIVMMPFIISILGLFILVEISNFYTDTLDFVEDILRLITSTGELSLYPSATYYTFQMISFIVVIFYTMYIEKEMSDNIMENIEKQIKEIGKSKNDNTEQLVFEVKQLLLNNGFDEKLKKLKMFKDNSVKDDSIKKLLEKKQEISSDFKN